MKKIQLLFVIFAIIGLLYIPMSAYSNSQLKSVVLSISAYLTYMLSLIGYDLSRGK